MNWYKFRECSSSGYSSWSYTPIDPDTAKTYGGVGKYIRERFSFNDWSEHFRGVEYFRIKHPPRLELKRQIESAKARAKAYREEAKALQAELAKIPEASGEAEITVHSRMGRGIYEVWAVVIENKKQIYKGRKGKTRSVVVKNATEWCNKANLDILRINSKIEHVKEVK